MKRPKEKLRRGEVVLVFNPNFPSPALVEHAGELGFDVAFIDCEHGTAGFERVEELARAARAAGMTSILRPWCNEPGLLTRFLDCGIGGLQLPHVDNRTVAEEMVATVRAARGARFEETLVVAMIESPTAVANISEIVSVEGLDAVVIGMADLCSTLGHPGNAQHADVQRAVGAVAEAARASGRVAAGFNLHHWQNAQTLMQQGFRWFTIHARTMLARGTQQLRSALGDELAKTPRSK